MICTGSFIHSHIFFSFVGRTDAFHTDGQAELHADRSMDWIRWIGFGAYFAPLVLAGFHDESLNLNLVFSQVALALIRVRSFALFKERLPFFCIGPIFPHHFSANRIGSTTNSFFFFFYFVPLSSSCEEISVNRNHTILSFLSPHQLKFLSPSPS